MSKKFESYTPEVKQKISDKLNNLIDITFYAFEKEKSDFSEEEDEHFKTLVLSFLASVSYNMIDLYIPQDLKLRDAMNVSKRLTISFMNDEQREKMLKELEDANRKK